MKRKIILTSIIFILIVFFSSCDVKPMEEGRSVNEYIFPYVKFELSKDGSYYTATIVSGAKVSSIYIPAYAEDNENPSLPIKVFKGFENEEDMVNLKTVTIESSITDIEEGCLDKASGLSRITYNSKENEDDLWTKLPQLEHTEEKEFRGWLLVVNDGNVVSDGKMEKGFTSIYPNWGTHTFGETKAGQEPTCTEAGYTSYHGCRQCTYTSKVILPALGHNLVKHEKSDADCKTWTYGYSETCWECTRCGALFSDSEGNNEIEKSVKITPSHTVDGQIHYNEECHWYECSVCGKVYDKEEHTYGDWYNSADGKRRERECIKCPYVQSADIKHNWEEVGETDSSCTVKGHRVYWRCTIHEGEYSTTEDHEEIINETQLHEEVDKELLDHDFSGGWSSNGESHWHVCLSCKGIFDTKEHDFEYTFTVNKEKREMSVKRKCIVCGFDGASTPSPGESAFDISASFGKIRVVKKSTNVWTLSYYGSGDSCYWTDEKGTELLEGSEPFTITYLAEGEGEFKVFCYSFDSSGSLDSISFAALTGY